jgi:hypothetical protein
MAEQKKPEPDEPQSFNIKAWYIVMVFCIVGLGILGFISKDTSVRFYIIWAIFLLCFAPEINMLMGTYEKAIKAIDFLKHEDIKRAAAEAVEAKKQQLSAEQG